MALLGTEQLSVVLVIRWLFCTTKKPHVIGTAVVFHYLFSANRRRNMDLSFVTPCEAPA